MLLGLSCDHSESPRLPRFVVCRVCSTVPGVSSSATMSRLGVGLAFRLCCRAVPRLTYSMKQSPWLAISIPATSHGGDGSPLASPIHTCAFTLDVAADRIWHTGEFPYRLTLPHLSGGSGFRLWCTTRGSFFLIRRAKRSSDHHYCGLSGTYARWSNRPHTADSWP